MESASWFMNLIILSSTSSCVSHIHWMVILLRGRSYIYGLGDALEPMTADWRITHSGSQQIIEFRLLLGSELRMASQYSLNLYTSSYHHCYCLSPKPPTSHFPLSIVRASQWTYQILSCPFLIKPSHCS